jgi:spermidine synthase
MNRKAFLLGFLATGGQVLLLREIVSSLNGDELFIGTSLFGWLLAVGFGSYLGGKFNRPGRSFSLFIIGSIILPISIVLTRLSPTIMGNTIGQIVPFWLAFLISIIMVGPTAFISGWLFASITSEGHKPAASIVQVYLFEGLGAFVGGIIVVAMLGTIYSTLAMALAVGLIVISGLFINQKKIRIIITAVIALSFLVIIYFLAPTLDRYFDAVRYSSCQIKSSFDTPYGHTAILSRENLLTIMTDNTIEASYPDLNAAENYLLPPLLYFPEARDILYIGRAELGVMQLADSIPGLKITALDPRKSLSESLARIFNISPNLLRLDDDPVAYFSKASSMIKYDIIIINSGEPDNYKTNRLLTEHFFILAKLLLKPNGILYVPADYDTDRHISLDKAAALATLAATMKNIYGNIFLWPGEMTLFFASDSNRFNIPIDTLLLRAKFQSYRPQYISPDYLPDRLENMKLSRLNDAVGYSATSNKLAKPVLIYNQANYRAGSNAVDAKLIPILYNSKFGAILILIPTIMLFFFCLLARKRRRIYGLFLYFIAGLVSLSAELIAFYLYQSTAGSLYLELGVLIGAFMLGLSIGTYLSLRANQENLEFPGLILLAASLLFFYLTYSKVSPGALLYYYLLFLMTTAIATGTIFVAATDRFYFGKPESNRGLGYGLELAGSSLGALFPVVILLPLFGLNTLLISITTLIIVAIIGAILSR